MITLEEAKRLIAHSSKLNHSLLVSSLMGRLAGFLDSDLDTWMLVGLLHDLDYDETVDDRTKHGVIAANRLSGMLPEEALLAIQRHDHRTGMLPETDLDYALIFCDAVSMVLEAGELELPVLLDEFNECLEQVCVEKPWLRDIIHMNPILEKIELKEILETK